MYMIANYYNILLQEDIFMNIILYHGSEITVGQPIWEKEKNTMITDDEEIKPNDVRLR